MIGERAAFPFREGKGPAAAVHGDSVPFMRPHLRVKSMADDFAPWFSNHWNPVLPFFQ